MPLFRRSRPRTLSSLDAYARWAGSYPPHAHNALMRAEEAALLDLLPPLGGRIVLDAACGSGRYARIALERGARCVIATDNSPEMLRQIPKPSPPPLSLRERGLDDGEMREDFSDGRGMPRPHSALQNDEARFVQPSTLSTQHSALSTLAALPLASGCIDVSICGLAIGHLPRIDRAFAELARVLVVGGVALVSDVHPFLFLGGAQRTFESGGKTYAVEHTVHLYSAAHEAARAAGLRIDAVREPSLLPGDRTPDAPTAPVAIVYRMVKE
jgi:malonyl-CoA O-methyltransferase